MRTLLRPSAAHSFTSRQATPRWSRASAPTSTGPGRPTWAVMARPARRSSRARSRRCSSTATSASFRGSATTFSVTATARSSATTRTNAARVATKDSLLRNILGYPLRSHVAIDYVESLGDQKTAWDYIHFEGFLGFKMHMQFTWHGCDSVLAAPLILDMARPRRPRRRAWGKRPSPPTGLLLQAPGRLRGRRPPQAVAHTRAVRDRPARGLVHGRAGNSQDTRARQYWPSTQELVACRRSSKNF